MCARRGVLMESKGPLYTEHQRQPYDDASDSDLIEDNENINGVTPEWGCNPL